MDVELLLSSVQAVPAIWDASHPQHSDRVFISNQWSMIADALQVSEEAARKKYKTLRDKFRVELKKLPQGKSGTSGLPPESYESKWPFFKMCFFMKDQMYGKQTIGNLSEMASKQSYIDGQQSELISASITSTSAQDNDDAFEGLVEPGIDETPGNMAECSKEPYKKKRKVQRDIREHFLQVEKEKLEYVKGKSEPDECSLFLQSVAPSMQSMSKRNQCVFKIKVQELVYKFLHEENEE